MLSSEPRDNESKEERQEHCSTPGSFRLHQLDEGHHYQGIVVSLSSSSSALRESPLVEFSARDVERANAKYLCDDDIRERRQPSGASYQKRAYSPIRILTHARAAH